MASFSAKRLQRELRKLESQTPPGITLISAPDFANWTLDIRVLDDTHPLYAHKTFRLHFTFSDSYPLEPPEVVFALAGARSATDPAAAAAATAQFEVPLHPHIYSNGIICLDLLDKQAWSPAHCVESVCISLQSMLAGNVKGERPPNDDQFVRTNRTRPRDIRFLFHDEQLLCQQGKTPLNSRDETLCDGDVML